MSLLKTARNLASWGWAVATALLEEATSARRDRRDVETASGDLADAYQREAEQLRVDLAEEVRVGAEGRAAADKVRADLETAHRKRAELETRLAVAQKALKGADAEKGRLHSALDNEVARREAADSLYERTRQQLVDLRQEVDDALARATRAEGDLAKARAGWQDIAAAEQKTGDRAAIERDAAQSTLKQVREQNGRLATMIQDLQAELQRAEAERDEQRGRAESLARQLADKTKAAGDLESERDGVQGTLDRVMGAISRGTKAWHERGPGDAEKRAEVLPDIADLVDWLLLAWSDAEDQATLCQMRWLAAGRLIASLNEVIAPVVLCGGIANMQTIMAAWESYTGGIPSYAENEAGAELVARWFYEAYRLQRAREDLARCPPAWPALGPNMRERFLVIARRALGMEQAGG